MTLLHNNESPFGTDHTYPDVADAAAQLKRLHEKKTALSQPVYDMLSWAAKRICYQPPNSGITYVLAINSGYGHDAIALNSFFGSKPNGTANEAAHIYCIERSTAQHAAAFQHNCRVGWKNQEFTLQPPGFYHFLNADPINLSEIPLPGQFHAVTLRNLDVSNPDYPWQRILVDALDMLAPDGIAIITTRDSSIESIPLRELFSDSNYKLLLHDRNPHAQNDTQSHIHLDAMVTAVRKSESYEKPADPPPIPAAYCPGTVNELVTEEVFDLS